MSEPSVSAYEPASALFKALANPLRVAIVHLLSQQERSVGQLVVELGVTQPLISQHLRVLREARLVAPERIGQQIRYRICDQHVAHVVGDAINHIQEEACEHQH